MSSDKVEEAEPTLEEQIEEAKRHFALKEWSQASDAYGLVLEMLRETHDEGEPLYAPLYHRYGHALLEHAIATSGALGGGGGSKEAFVPDAKTVASARSQKPASDKTAEKALGQATASSSKSIAHDPRFTFGGDAEESDEEGEGGPAAAEKDGIEDDDDDLSLAFSILELARVAFEKVLAQEDSASLKTVEGEEWSTVMVKSQLAEVLNDLADVGLESENFQQASADYRSALDMLTPLLQPHSRRLADAYLRLGLALEFHPDASSQATAGKFVTGACTTLERRVEVLTSRQRILQRERETGENGLAKIEAAAAEVRTEKIQAESEERLKGKGLAEGGEEEIFEKDEVAAMDWEQVEKERKDISEMIQELRLKLEEYANAASEVNGTNAASSGSSLEIGTAKERVQQAINEALLGSSTNAFAAPPSDPNAPVNDLSGMVKKKSKPASAVPETEENGKRKEEALGSSEAETSKKQKIDG